MAAMHRVLLPSCSVCRPPLSPRIASPVSLGNAGRFGFEFGGMTRGRGMEEGRQGFVGQIYLVGAL
jgi:hypothetical protein